MIVVLVLGVALCVVGVLGIVFRDQLDAANMRSTPKWMKPPDGGGVFAPSQRHWRIVSTTIGMSLLTAMGLALIIIAFTVNIT